jgi:glutamate decarboxylase
MVHLNAIKKDHEINQPLVPGMEKLSIDNESMSNTFTTSVYGSKFAAEDLPKNEMPENEMPKEVAYRMIKDDLSLDGNPMLKYAILLQLSCVVGLEKRMRVNLGSRLICVVL